MTELRATSTRFFSARARRVITLPDPELAGFDAEHVRFASRAWTMRAEEEHRSAATFAGLAHAMIASGAPLDVADAAIGIARDEVAHATLCANLASRFGASAPRASTAADTPRAEAGGTFRLALRLWLVEGAIGETISSALFARGRNLATEPCTRAALDAILRDEVIHARIAWEALSVLTHGLADCDRAWLEDQARIALGAIEDTQMVPVLRRLERGEAFEPAWAALGVLPSEQRVEVFYDTIERRIRRRLERLGVDFTRAWEHRYRGDSRPT